MIAKIKNYFSGVSAEAKKVSWPSKKEVINHTTTVVIVVALIMIVFGSLDYGLTKLLEFVINTWS